MSEFRVGTFYTPHPGSPVKRSHIRAYTTWFNPSWDGCRVYCVEAESGAEAKRIAIDMRLREEKTRGSDD